MLATLLFAAGAMAVLLAVDLALAGRREHAGPPTTARRLSQGARVLSLFLLAATVARARPADAPLLATIGWMALFGFTGLLAFELARAVAFTVMRELAPAGDGTDNRAAATAGAAHTVAVGVLAANVFGGSSLAELGVAAASFVVGQSTLLLLVWLFRCLTSYDDRAQILAGNVAAALSHGGLTVALALLIAHATDGEYLGPGPALRGYGIALAEGLAVWPLRQLLVECVLLRHRPRLLGGELDRAIAGGDVGAGALEGATYLGIVLMVRSVA